MAWSRRDQIEANRFLGRRSMSALVLAEPDHPQSPTRRYVAATIGGLVAVVIGLGAFGVYGLLRPGSATKWQTPGAIVVQKDPSSLFVLDDNKVLHPVLNYASARLILGSENPPVVSVSATSLRDAKRGQPIGIPDAPVDLPGTASLVSQAWTVCERAVPGEPTPRSTVVLGNPPAGTDVPGGVLVTDPSHKMYLLAGGRRFAIGSRAVLGALNYTGVTPLAVPADWLDVIPAGSDLRFAAVAGRGRKPAWAAPAGVRVGQILQVGASGPNARYFLVERDGIRLLSPIGLALALGDPAAASAYPGSVVKSVEVAPAATAYAPTAPALTAPPDYPTDLPVLTVVAGTGGVAVCAQVPGGANFTLVPTSELAALLPTPVTAPTGRLREVAVPSGAGAVVQAGGTGGMIYLITGQGRRYPMPDPAARTALGYRTVTPVVLPVALLDLLPTGPVLDRSAAGRIGAG